MRQEEETLRNQEWKDFFKAFADSVSLDEEKKERIFAEAQERIQERSQNMYKIKKKKTMFVAAAAAAVMLGTITAVGAGTVEGLFTSIHTDQVDYRSGKEMKAAERVMGAVPKAPDQFSNGLEFQAGYLTSVNGADESGTIVESYPGISVSYGEDVSLFIEKVPASMKQEKRDADAAAEYKGIQLELTADPYLFLPRRIRSWSRKESCISAMEPMRKCARCTRWFPGKRTACPICFPPSATRTGLRI